MAKSYDEHYVNAEKQNLEAEQKRLNTIDVGADKSIKLAEDTYKTAEKNTVVGYESDYARNAVQKLINEKQIAERNANLGLTDSGLNRTQQTAAQLSYANQKGDIDIAKQQALDKLSSDLAAYITDVNNQRESNKASIEQYYDQLNSQTATEMYNAELEDERERWETEYDAAVRLQEAAIAAQAEVDKAAYSANGNEEEEEFLLWRSTGTTDEYGNLIFINSDSKTQAFGKGVNPYTGTTHRYVKYGTFDNGYQPNNLGYVENEKGEKVLNKLEPSGERDYVHGKEQTVWIDIYGIKWIWDGSINDYREYKG